ncbi:MAG: glycosyltransferase, partial [bacterium]
PKDLKHFLKRASLMLITSYQEGFGISGLEALAYGIPVISTDCGGVRDFVIKSITGYLVDINDDKDMAIKALRIISSQNFHAKVSEQARAFVEQHFSHQIIYKRFKLGLIKVYPELEEEFKLSDKQQQKNKPLKNVVKYESVGH